jgi:hypothetical protein
MKPNGLVLAASIMGIYVWEANVAQADDGYNCGVVMIPGGQAFDKSLSGRLQNHSE